MITRAELPTAVGSSQAPTAVDNSVFHLFFGVHTLGTGSISRALLLAGVGRATQHANQTTIHLTPMHAAKGALLTLVANVRMALAHVRDRAEQLLSPDRWGLFLDYVIAKIVPRLPPKSMLYALRLDG